MKHSDIAALMKGVAPAVRDLIVELTKPLIDEVADLKRQIAEFQVLDVAASVKAAVDEAAAALPKPQDGKDGRDGVDGKDGAPGEKGEPGEPGQDGANGADGRNGEKGADGVGLADAVIDRDGSLVLTMADGRTKKLGAVVGKDGADGRDGAAGEPGRDGFGFDDLDVVDTDDGLALRFVRGEVVKEFPLPVIIDRGVFKEGAVYRKGNGVTWGGSFWIAQKDAPEGKPDSPDSGWRLAVKRGQNGKDASK